MTADDDPREGKIAAEFLDAQFELAIVEQQGCTVNQGREDFRVRKIDAVRIALGRVEVEAERGTGHQGDAARGKFADTQLRALQVPQNADRPVELASDAPDGVEALLVFGLGSMTEIQAEHVDAGDKKFPDDFLRGAGGTKRCNNLGVSISAHNFPVWILGARDQGQET